MFKYVFAAIVCLAISFPVAAPAQDCGCCQPAPAPCVKTRKRLKLVDVQQEVCRAKLVCGTDACGCPTKQLVRGKQMVTRKKLTLVEEPVDPCGCKGRGPWKKFVKGLDRVKCKMGINPAKHCANGGCGSPVMAPAAGCGCAAPAPAPCCGGGAVAAPMGSSFMAEPSMASPVIAAPVMADPMSTDVAPLIEAPASSSILEAVN